jgi:hypothetical protein
MWIRAVRRSQEQFTAAAAHADPVEAGVAAALSVYDYCARHRADALLLLSFRREDLVKGALPAALADELARLNEPVERTMADLARRLYGRVTRRTLDLVALAVFDLPHGAVRRPLIGGERLSEERRSALEAAVRAALVRPAA